MQTSEITGGGGKIVKIPAADINDTPFAGVRFAFCDVTPELAAEWLKHNRRNRKVKDTTVEAYAMDMRNGAWQATHQGVAFDPAGNLIDGQHRLQGIVQARRPVLMVVSHGWPAVLEKRKTMDAVDRGATRSLADQLHLQHDVPHREAARVVQICNALAAACFGVTRVSKSTTDTILSVYGLYKNEIAWVMANPLQQHGLKQATVAACLAMARAVWADKTEDAMQRLTTGENLTKENPILALRNWLMGAGAREENTIVRLAIFHHLAAFVDGKSCATLVTTSSAAYVRILKLHQVRVEKICAWYSRPLPECLATASKKPAANASPVSPEAIKVGESLANCFTSTDLRARTDDNAGQWLLVWLNRGWIESAGSNQFRKTDKFGK